jgi:transposase
LAALVEAGPDGETDGLVRWRRIDLKQVIRERFGADYHERSVSRLLHDLGFSHMSARPQHPKQNARMMDMFKKISRTRSRRRSRIGPPARP